MKFGFVHLLTELDGKIGQKVEHAHSNAPVAILCHVTKNCQKLLVEHLISFVAIELGNKLKTINGVVLDLWVFFFEKFLKGRQDFGVGNIFAQKISDVAKCGSSSSLEHDSLIS